MIANYLTSEQRTKLYNLLTHVPKEKEQTKQAIDYAIQYYRLDINGIHGFEHWYRVAQKGIDCSEDSTADKLVIILFAFFHDSCRENDYRDKNHGKRASELVASLRDDMFYFLTRKQFS